MENTKTMKELLETYYRRFAQKQGWESVISEDFRYVGGDMSHTEPSVGKSAYIAIINRFSRIFQSMRVREMIVDGNKACVIGNYDYLFPNGEKMNGNVAELWTSRDGKLDSLTIYFDTLTFDKNTPR